ncbi:hypothetical protein CB1_000349006 [Camelus ferus]|nr:hypothetical protein CB1_000349006 [Camelus ferus]
MQLHKASPFLDVPSAQVTTVASEIPEIPTLPTSDLSSPHAAQMAQGNPGGGPAKSGGQATSAYGSQVSTAVVIWKSHQQLRYLEVNHTMHLCKD